MTFVIGSMAGKTRWRLSAPLSRDGGRDLLGGPRAWITLLARACAAPMLLLDHLVGENSLHIVDLDRKTSTAQAWF
jgi:hypothetical protein